MSIVHHQGEWRNWYTRTTQNRVPYGLRVRFPPRPPMELFNLSSERFLYTRVMLIRSASLSDAGEIISLLERSQHATGLPNPAYTPPETLGVTLYQRDAIERFVAVEAGQIVGHALIERSNPAHEANWRQALHGDLSPLIEMGGAFVEPTLSGRGIWTALLKYRMSRIRALDACPVTATWNTNGHVKRRFLELGGVSAGEVVTPRGVVDLFVFSKLSVD